MAEGARKRISNEEFKRPQNKEAKEAARIARFKQTPNEQTARDIAARNIKRPEGMKISTLEDNAQAAQKRLAEQNIASQTEQTRLANLQKAANAKPTNKNSNLFNVDAINKSRNERLSKEKIAKALEKLKKGAPVPKRPNEVLDMGNLFTDDNE